MSVLAILAAAPSPTTNGVGTVPLRIPRSCPPPENNGSIRTLGLRRTNRAPTPIQVIGYLLGHKVYDLI
jgi:hypothetical protein